MQQTTRVTGLLQFGLGSVAVVALLFGALLPAEVGRARQETAEAEATIRVVHGVANAGPLDVYIDGAVALIGLAFGDTSGNVALNPGDREIAVVPSGASPEGSIVEGQITLEEGFQIYAALLGAVDEPSVGLYVVDNRPVDAGRARFRVISGVADAGEITPSFAGGDALSEPLGFGDATQYAAIDAGVYDLEILDAATGGSILSLPQTPLAEGTTTDIILIGLVGDGTLQALVTPTALETAAFEGQVAQILSGACATAGPVVADLGVVEEGQGTSVGVPDAPTVAQGFGLAPLSFTALTESPHAVAVVDGAIGEGSVLACGEIGGRLTDTGALVIAIEAAAAGGADGVAVLAPSLENPEATGVSVFLTGVTTESSASNLAPVSEEGAD